MSRGSKLRRKAIFKDVERRTWYAFSSGNRANPYPQDDKRHPLFDRKLASIEFMDQEFEDMNQACGCDSSTWSRRVHPNPGPVRPIEQLALQQGNDREQKSHCFRQAVPAVPQMPENRV